jgi:hypothetical protein
MAHWTMTSSCVGKINYFFRRIHDHMFFGRDSGRFHIVYFWSVLADVDPFHHRHQIRRCGVDRPRYYLPAVEVEIGETSPGNASTGILSDRLRRRFCTYGLSNATLEISSEWCAVGDYGVARGSGRRAEP